MEILNTICYGCALVLSASILVLAISIFITSIISCFSKKVEGSIVVKIAVALTLGCICPWIFRLSVFFFDKMLGM